MLFLVGVGLANSDISAHAASVLKKSRLYIDAYTSFIDSGRISFIEGIAGKAAIRLSRSDMEENAWKLVEESKKADVAIAAGGDPLVATTHKIIAIEAEKRGAKIEIIHAPSIITAAIGESGLDFYRFGSVCTIPAWHEHYRPVSFYSTMHSNYSSNLHSLLLFDYDSGSNASMPIADALRILKEGENRYGKGLINANAKIIVMVNIGMPSAQKLYGSISLLEKYAFDKGPAVIIVPAKLESIERESMAAMRVIGLEQ